MKKKETERKKEGKKRDRKKIDKGIKKVEEK